MLASIVLCVSSSSKSRFLIVFLKNLWLLRKLIKGKFTFINTETRNILSKLFGKFLNLFLGMQIDIDQRACAQVTQETQGKVFQTVSQTFGFIVFKKLNLVFKCVIPCFNLTRMGVGAKRLHTSFSTGTSTNVWIGPQNFLTFIFTPFAALLLNFKAIPSTSPKLLNWI